MTVFEIPGQPFGKQRPRFNMRSGRVYTPSKTISAETAIAKAAAPHFSQPIEGPVAIRISAVFCPAKSWSKKKTLEHLGQYHLQKPDLDNVTKAILDALNGIAYRDDSQVAQAETVKVWGPVARTVITVKPL